MARNRPDRDDDVRWRRWGYPAGYGPHERYEPGGYGPGGYIGDYFGGSEPIAGRGFYHRDRDPYTGYGPRYGARGRDERGMLDRAGDEIASWFGDEEAERRREMDARFGPHRGRGPKGYRRSDARVHEEVSDRLADDPWLDASDIEVGVEEGEVTLEGTVESRADKRRAEDIAEAVSGVRDVHNRLRVRPQVTTAAGTEAEGRGRRSR